MKKELLGYTVIFMKKEENPLPLSIQDGESLKVALAEGNNFIEISSKNIMLRANTIDRVAGRFRKLEEKCLFCYMLKPVHGRCPRGCDEPNHENLEMIAKYKRKIGGEVPKISYDSQEEETSQCKACNTPCVGSYCNECAKIYD